MACVGQQSGISTIRGNQVAGGPGSSGFADGCGSSSSSTGGIALPHGASSKLPSYCDTPALSVPLALEPPAGDKVVSPLPIAVESTAGDGCAEPLSHSANDCESSDSRALEGSEEGKQAIPSKSTSSISSTELGSDGSSSSAASESDADSDSDTDSESETEGAACGTDGTRRNRRARPPTPISPETTIMIFDWDDTLLPSTWIRENSLRLDAESVATEEQQAQLDRVAKGVAHTLRAAERYGKVVLVTNAESGWIELSCKKFMPSLYPVLENMRAVSARSTYEHQGVSSPFEWKYLAFEYEVQQFYKSVPAERMRNVISFGDSAHEREALIRVTQRMPNCCTKSLKFVERPEPEQLLKEHDLISGCVRRVARRLWMLSFRA
eukprot:TRINITY_DN24336_c0_g1_i2.p1 TRINITY_DN24336_c0_g1~~TRINITY_DN24336_c0_g1_i2.p1  ORF type:complete len:381 (+),score=71.86 TRINITY_DN24336_c0_g1_i2:135-1277(+)